MFIVLTFFCVAILGQCKFLVFVRNSGKVDFCEICNEILMTLKWTMKNIENHELSIVQKPLFFERILAFLLGGDPF